jgi:RNA polymerase sigma-70 factor (ECF subfamily)
MRATDATLANRCIDGDQEAFRGLFEQNKDLVFRTAYLMLGSAADAEDVLQDVFLQAHRRLDTYDPTRGSLKTWLHRVTVNRCLNVKRSRRLTLAEADVETMADRSAAGPDESVAEQELLRSALDNLSENLRVVLVLRHYGGLPYADIAQTLDLPLGTVKSRLNLAMHQMRDQLSPSPQNHMHPSKEAGR